MTERFQWIQGALTKICDLHDLDVMMALIAKSLADDEFYSDEEVAKGLRMATKIYTQKKERLENGRDDKTTCF